MQITKYAFFLVLGIGAQACGGDSDDGGGGSTGGSSSSGGSTGKGGSSSGSTGKGGSGGASSGGASSGASSGGASTGGASTGGASSGGSATGGVSGTGGTGGACTGGQVDFFDSCDVWDCVFQSACAQAGAQQEACIDAIKAAFQDQGGTCVPAADAAAACDMVKADPDLAMTFPECV